MTAWWAQLALLLCICKHSWQFRGCATAARCVKQAGVSAYMAGKPSLAAWMCQVYQGSQPSFLKKAFTTVAAEAAKGASWPWELMQMGLYS